jgi:CelD/BcsL family acetyltransferase involved in cellulose biosynthesis
MRTELVNRMEDLQPLNSRWNELALSDPRDGFFRTFQWYYAWLRHIRPDAEPFVIVVRDDAGEIAGLAPLCRMTYRDHGFRLKSVSSAGREVVSGDFLDYLSIPDQRQATLDSVMSFLWEAKAEWDMLVVGEISEDSDLERAVRSFADKQGLPVRRQEERICPFIELPADFESFLAGISSNVRYKLRRDTRDLIEKRGAKVVVHSDPAHLPACLDTLIRLHQAHWHHIGQPGTLGRPGFRDFLLEVCTTPPPGGTTRLYILEHEDKPVAAHLTFWFGKSALFYQSGWNPQSEVARLSPGMVLFGHGIRDAIENGHRYFDFLRGDESYKNRLTKVSRKTATLLVGRSLLAKQYLGMAQLKDSVKRLISSRGAAETVA